MKCPKCRHENPPESTYCGKCATRLGGHVPGTSPFDSGRPNVTETMQGSPEELATGSTFAGRYQIIEELGRGGMGRVYRALDKKLNEEVALKLVRPEIAADRSILERFHKEGFAYSSIHPTEDFESLAGYPPYIQLMKPKG